MKIPDFSIEKKYWSLGRLVAGVDEAGRGALAGPVFASAVIYPRNFEPNFDVYDSKTISRGKREKLYELIVSNCLAFSVEKVDTQYIDETNILSATFKAMNQALEKLRDFKPFVIVDGNKYDGNFEHRVVIDGDAISFSIASASILAKVERDRWMETTAHTLFPQYGFDKHKGYGTRHHIEKILQCDPSPLHRKTFLRKILNGQLKLWK